MNRTMVIVFVLAALLTACQPAMDKQEELSQVRLLIEQADYQTARIQLQNLAVEFPEDQEIRIVLADTLMSMGSYASAEKEYERAIELGNSDTRVASMLALANIYLSDFEDVIQITEKLESNDRTSAQITTYAGIAHAGLGDLPIAIEQFTAASESSESDQYAQLSKAYLQSQEGNTELAIKTLDFSSESSAIFLEGIYLRGKLQLSISDFESAAESLALFYKNQPESREAKLFLANALVQKGDLAAARPHIESLIQEFPNQAFVNQMMGLVYFYEGDFEQAKFHAERAISNGYSSDIALVIQGLSAYRLGLFEQAHRALRTVVSRLPLNHPANRAFLLTQLSLGYETDTESHSNFIENLDEDDIDVATLLGTKLADEGKIEQAQNILNELSTVNLKNAEDYSNIGLLKLRLEDPSGVEDLRLALQKSPELTNAKLGLIDAYVKLQDYEALLALGNEIISSGNDIVLGYNTVGLANRLLGKVSEAKEAYKQALEIDQRNPASRVYLAKQSLAENLKEDAINYLTPLVSDNPEYEQGIKLLFSIYQQNGQTDKAIAVLQEALEKAPDSQMLKISLARAYLSESRYEDVKNTLKIANLEPRYAETYYLTLLETNLQEFNISDAEALLSEWVNDYPKSETAALSQIAFLEQFNRAEDARDALNRALDYLPSSSQFRALKIKQEIERGYTKNAANLLQKMPEEFKATLAARALDSHLKISENKYEGTLPVLLEAYKESPTLFNAKGIIKIYKGLNQPENAVQFLQERVDAYPGDVYSRSILANLTFYEAPENSLKQYEYILKVQPTNIIAANNLAWLLFEANQLEKARTVSLSALSIRRNIPSLLHTAGRIEYALGNFQSAADLLAEAFLMSPSPLIGYYYASSLVNLGKSEDALAILKSLQTSGDEALDQNITQLNDKLRGS